MDLREKMHGELSGKLTVTELAREWGVSRSHIKMLIKIGALRVTYYQDRTPMTIDRADAEQYAAKKWRGRERGCGSR